MDIQMRAINNQDFYTVVDMLLKVQGLARKELAGLISSRKKELVGTETEDEKQALAEETGKQMGWIIFEVCYRHVKQDLINWFASLCEKTTDEFLLQLPPEATIQVLEHLLEAQETSSFFTRAWGLFKKMQSLGSRFIGELNL